MTSWCHPKCFNLPRKYATGSGKITEEQFVEDHIEDVSEDGDILPSKVAELAAAIGTKASPKKTKSEGSGTENSFMEKLKSEYDAMAAEDDDKTSAKRKANDNSEQEPKKKKSKASDDDQNQRALELYAKHHKMNAAALKDILSYNRQTMTGTKAVVLHKVIDGELNGRLPRCKVCEGGRLKFNEACDKVICGGGFDEGSQQRISCDVSYTFGDAPRELPWYTTNPTEEQNAEMDHLTELAKAGGVDNGPALTKLMKAAANLELDYSSNKGKKESATKLIELLESSEDKLDLPDESKKLRMGVGSLLLANEGAAPSEIVKMLVEKFGFVDAKAEKAAKKEAAVENACKQPENAPIYCAIKELADLYFKESNRNAGASYQKAVSSHIVLISTLSGGSIHGNLRPLSSPPHRQRLSKSSTRS